MGNGGTPNNGVVTIDVFEQECSVAPIELLANVGDTVVFENLTQGRVIVFFPDAGIFGQRTFEIDAGGKVTVTVGNVESGSYPYTVFCECTDGFADRAARPRIIVFTDVSK